MKKDAVYFALLSVLVISLSACITPGGNNSQGNETTNNGLSDKFVHKTDENNTYTLTRNSFLKTAIVERTVIDDKNSKTSSVSLLTQLNKLACSALAYSFFGTDTEAIKSKNKLLQVNEWQNLLDGYRVTRVILDFRQIGTNELISHCEATGTADSQIKYTNYGWK